MNIDDVWEVYIIKTTSGKLYTGITCNVARRFSEHTSHKKGAKFFNIEQPEVIVYREIQKNRSEASKRESQIKKLTRIQKLELIKSHST
jgi:putative endonuclease